MTVGQRSRSEFVRDPADGWGQQQEQLVTVGLFLLVLLGTWLLAYLILGISGSWRTWFWGVTT